LLTLESAVGLQFDCLNVIIWILEEKPFYSLARTCIPGCAQDHEQSQLPEHAHRPANAGLGCSPGTDFHIEQVLLPPLPHIG
jgi:hypothetical protein